MLPPDPLQTPAQQEKPKVKNPFESIPVEQRHRFERIALALYERLKHRKELIEQYIVVNGRPAGMIPLTPEQRHQRFMDRELRLQTVRQLVAKGQPNEVRKLLDSAMDYAEGHRNGLPHP